MSTLVKIKVSSEEGHTEYSLVPKEAREKILELYDNGKRWIYVNGSNVSPSRLTDEMLESGPNVVMMNAVAGGNGDNEEDCGDCEYFDVCDSEVKEEYLRARAEEEDHGCGDEMDEDYDEDNDEFYEDEDEDEDNWVEVDPMEPADDLEGELTAEFDFEIKKFENEKGEVALDASDPSAIMVAVIEFIPANKEHNHKFILNVAEEHFTEFAHMRELIFEGLKDQIDGYLTDQLAAFRKTYNI